MFIYIYIYIHECICVRVYAIFLVRGVKTNKNTKSPPLLNSLDPRTERGQSEQCICY